MSKNYYLSKLENVPKIISNCNSIASYFLDNSGKAPYPNTIFITINSVCNLRCQMCDFGQKAIGTQFYENLNKGDELDLNTLKKLIDEVKKFKPLIAIISTEPLLYKDLIPFIKYCKENKLEVQVTTNGTLLSNFAEDFVKLKLDYLWVSIDGPSKIHDQIRGVENTYTKAMNGIQKIIALKKDKLDKPLININYTITELNVNYLIPFLKEIKEIPINQISFSHMNFVNESMCKDHNSKFGEFCPTTVSSINILNPKNTNIEELYNQITEIKKMNFNFNVTFVPNLSKTELFDYYNLPETFVTPKRCLVPWRVAQIQANGDLIPLTRCFNLVLGNIHQDSFKNIWNGPRYIRFRKLLKKEGAFPACSRCCGIF